MLRVASGGRFNANSTYKIMCRYSLLFFISISCSPYPRIISIYKSHRHYFFEKSSFRFFKPYQIEFEGSAVFILVHTVDDSDSLSHFFCKAFRCIFNKCSKQVVFGAMHLNFVGVFTLWFTHLVFFFFSD